MRTFVPEMKQIERIQEMEERFIRAAKAVTDLSAAAEQYAAAQDDLAALEHYMTCGAWRRDFEADEAGRLPADLKRGVLSEDALWNLLADNDELRKQMNL